MVKILKKDVTNCIACPFCSHFRDYDSSGQKYITIICPFLLDEPTDFLPDDSMWFYNNVRPNCPYDGDIYVEIGRCVDCPYVSIWPQCDHYNQFSVNCFHPRNYIRETECGCIDDLVTFIHPKCPLPDPDAAVFKDCTYYDHRDDHCPVNTSLNCRDCNYYKPEEI